MKNLKIYFTLFIVSLLYIPLSLADLGIADLLGNVGREIGNLLSNDGFLFAFIFVLVFMGLYAIFSTAINKLPNFKGSSYSPNKQGKILAISFSLIATSGIYFFKGGAIAFTKSILNLIGTFGVFALALALGSISYYNTDILRKWARIFGALFFACLTLGILLPSGEKFLFNNSQWMALAFLCLLLAFIFSFIRSSSDSDGNGNQGAGQGAGQGANQNAGQNQGAGQDGAQNRGSRPNQVQNFTAQQHPNGNVVLSWNPNSANENVTGYEVEKRNPNNRVFNRWNNIFNGNNNHCQDNLDFSSTNYKYRIRAVNNNGKSGWSEINLQVPLITVTGRIIRDGLREQVIDALIVRLVHPTRGIQVQGSTDSQGIFRLQLPQNSGLYQISVTDPFEVFPDENFNNSFPINTDDSTLSSIDIGHLIGGHLRLIPNSSATSRISLNLQDENGFYTGAVSILIIGNFSAGVITHSFLNTNGRVNIDNIPAGNVISVKIVTPTGESNAQNFLFLRERKSYLFPDTPIVNHTTEINVSGLVRDVSRFRTGINIPNVNINFKSTSTAGTENNINSGPGGDYSIRLHRFVGYDLSVNHHLYQLVPNAYTPPIIFSGNTTNYHINVIPRVPIPRALTEIHRGGRRVTVRF